MQCSSIHFETWAVHQWNDVFTAGIYSKHADTVAICRNIFCPVMWLYLTSGPIHREMWFGDCSCILLSCKPIGRLQYVDLHLLAWSYIVMGPLCQLAVNIRILKMLHHAISDIIFLYQLAQAWPHNVLHFLMIHMHVYVFNSRVKFLLMSIQKCQYINTPQQVLCPKDTPEPCPKDTPEPHSHKAPKRW